MYSEVFRVTFFVFRARFFAFCISQHFVPRSAFVQKFKRFCSLFFRSINKTRNLPEMRKVYGECFVFRGLFCENNCEIRKVYSWPNDNSPINILTTTQLSDILKPAIHLSFLAFPHGRALFLEIANQSLYTSHNISDFVHI